MFKETSLRPRYAETDQMGVIYHGNYFTYFEVARSDFFRQNGYSYKMLEGEGVIMPVTESGCKYYKPVLYDDEILIRTHLNWNGKLRTQFTYQIFSKTSEELLAEGFTKHAFVGKDLKPLKVRSLSEGFLNVLQAYMGETVCD